MSMSMREKMARALYDCADKRDRKLGCRPRIPFDENRGATWDGREMWYALADAALEALMEPTEAMLDAAQIRAKAVPSGDPDRWRSDADMLRAGFTDMIRAAKEGK